MRNASKWFPVIDRLNNTQSIAKPDGNFTSKMTVSFQTKRNDKTQYNEYFHKFSLKLMCHLMGQSTSVIIIAKQCKWHTNLDCDLIFVWILLTAIRLIVFDCVVHHVLMFVCGLMKKLADEKWCWSKPSHANGHWTTWKKVHSHQSSHPTKMCVHSFVSILHKDRIKCDCREFFWLSFCAKIKFAANTSID